MDFGIRTMESLVGGENHQSSSQRASNPETSNQKGHGSGFLKQERSGSGEDIWRSAKMSRTDDFSGPKTMLYPQGTPMLRSNSVATGDGGQYMLNFSSTKAEVPFLSANGGERTTQTPSFSFYQQPPAYSRNAGYSGGLNAGMSGPFARFRGPFTPSQWMELEHQALIYKYIVANVPVPVELLIPLKKALSPYTYSGLSSGAYAHSALGWGAYHLGFSGNTDPEPGRCRRTDGKKWRCSRDAVADQKYCDRHINRGRHRSRKPVEGQTGHTVTPSSTIKVPPIASSPAASSTSSSGASNSLGVMQHQLKTLQPVAANSLSDALVNRMRASQDHPMISPTINLKPKDSPFSTSKQPVPFEESSQSEFGLVFSDSLLNPSQKNSYLNSRNCNSFQGFNDRQKADLHPVRQFIDDLPKDPSDRVTVAWTEEIKSDWTQLSMSIPMASSDFSGSSNSPPRERVTLSPLRLSHEFDPIQMGLGVSRDISESSQKQTGWIPVSWGNSMGGPLGEVLNTTTSTTVVATKNSSVLNLRTDVWNRSPQFGSSPTGVLQKATFVSLSNSSSASSPRGDSKKAPEAASLCDDVIGSTHASSASMPSL